MENVEKVFEKTKVTVENQISTPDKESDSKARKAEGTKKKEVSSTTNTKANKSIKDIEDELGITLRFIEHIDRTDDEDTYHAVVESKNFGVKKQYRIRDIGHVPPDFTAHGIKIKANMFNDLVNMATENITQQVSGKFHTRIGWGMYHGQDIFKYREVVSKDDKIKSAYKGELNLDFNGTLETYVQGIQELVVPNKKLMIVYLAGASGIVTQQLKLPDSNIMLNVCGESGCGKTTAENVALSFWGNPMELATSFNSTANRTEQIMADRYIMPVLIDDMLAGNNFSTERVKQKIVSDQIFRYSTGKLKGRFNSTEDRYFGGTLVSSETPLFEKLVGSEADGQFYRMIEIRVKRGELTRDAKHARDLDRLIRWNYGLGAMELGKYMVEHSCTGQKLIDMYEGIYDELTEDERLKNHQRAANRLTILLLTATLMNDCFKFGMDIKGIKEELIKCMTEAFEISDMKVKKYWELLKLVQDNLDMFALDTKAYYRETHVGVFRPNTYGGYSLIIETDRMAPIIKGIELQQILEESGAEKHKNSPDSETNKILVNWRERGWLTCCNSNQRCYKKLTLGNSKKQSLVYEVVYSE